MIEATELSVPETERSSITIDGWLTHFVARISPFSTTWVKRSQSAAFKECLRAWLSSLQLLDSSRETLSVSLYQAIGRASDLDVRRKLVQLRRDVFNGRLIDKASLSSLKEWLTAIEFQLLDAYHGEAQALAEYRCELVRLFPEALSTARSGLVEIASSEPFKRGLLLSSESLFGRLQSYLDSTGGLRGARYAHVERGLSRYVTRAALKATPFGTFCSIANGTLVRSVEPAVSLAAHPSIQRSEVRLNKGIYSALWNHLKTRDSIRSRLAIALNPSLHLDSGRWRFLSASEKGEVFSRLERHPAIDVVIAELENEKSVTFAELVDRLHCHPSVEASKNEAEQFVSSLLVGGLLRISSVIEQNSDAWDKDLVEILEDSDDAHALVAVDLLRSCRVAIDEYPSLPASKRHVLLRRMSQLIRETLTSLGIDPGRTDNLPVYEDVASESSMTISVDKELSGLLTALRQYAELTSRLAYPRGAIASMRLFFDTTYPGVDAIPLLTFYEDFHRERVTRDPPANVNFTASADLSPAKEHPSILLANSIQFARRQIKECIREQWNADLLADELVVSWPTFVSTFEDVRPVVGCRSTTVFCQLAHFRKSEGGWRCVLRGGQTLPGYGKYYSRFLHLLNSEVLTEIRQTNRALTDAALAEICVDGDFNGNLHPQLVDFAIEYPTADATGEGTAIACRDLDVRRDPSDPTNLILTQRQTNCRVYPLDLGFLTPLRRPPLFQLLSCFIPAGSYALDLPEYWAAPLVGVDEPSSPQSFEVPPVDKITCRPRISLMPGIVIARKRWVIPAALFPTQSSNESEIDYLLRVNHWRIQNGIPDEVYARVAPFFPRVNKGAPEVQPDNPLAPADANNPDEENVIDAKENPRLEPSGFRGRDWAKPQFIDFNNPILVGLFPKLPGTLREYFVILEERYPSEDGLPTYANDVFTNELILQSITVE